MSKGSKNKKYHLTKTLSRQLQHTIKYLVTGSKSLTQQHTYQNLDNIDLQNIGLYLHIPFCRKPCVYCPYFKEQYNKKTALAYNDAVIKEITYYTPLLQDKAITSFYIGGGTPTTMIDTGLEDIIKTIKKSYNLTCGKVNATQTQRQHTRQFCAQQLNDDYQNGWPNIKGYATWHANPVITDPTNQFYTKYYYPDDQHAHNWTCAELIWAAYLHQEIEIDGRPHTIYDDKDDADGTGWFYLVSCEDIKHSENVSLYPHFTYP